MVQTYTNPSFSVFRNTKTYENSLRWLFVGCNTDVVDIYPLKRPCQLVNTLKDNICFRGAPTKLISDRAQVKISGRAFEFLHVYGISSWQSEPHQQQQNYVERRIQQLKQMTNVVMEWILHTIHGYLLSRMSHSCSTTPGARTSKMSCSRRCWVSRSTSVSYYATKFGRKSTLEPSNPDFLPTRKSVLDTSLVFLNMLVTHSPGKFWMLKPIKFFTDPYADQLQQINSTFVSNNLVGRALQYAPSSSQKLLIATIMT